MKKILTVLLLSLAIIFAQKVHAQKIRSYDASTLMQRITGSDTIYVVNFWATWCIPCVKELPSFNIVNDLYKGKPVKVLLLSFDFKEQYPEKLEAWIQKKKLRPEVAWFSETNPTEYIPKIAPEWEGGLPATLMLNSRTKQRLFLAEEITADRLREWIDAQLDQ